MSYLSIRPSVSPHWSEVALGTLNALDDGIMVTDLNHRTLICNESFGRIFPVRAQEAVRLDVEELRRRVAPTLSDPSRWLENLRHVYARPDGQQRDTLELKSVGTVIRYTGPVFGTQGEIIGRLWCFRLLNDRDRALALGDLRLDKAQSQALWKGQELPLTSLEFSLLWHLASARGRTIRREDLFEAVWGFSSDFSSNTLDVHISRLRRKLIGCGPASIRTRRGVGYRLDVSMSESEDRVLCP